MSRKTARPTGTIMESLDARTLLSATIAVANTADSGTGSLRAAIAAASAGDTIDLTQVSGTISLSSELSIDKNLTIVGPGVDSLTLSGNNAVRVIHINTGLTTTISGLTIADGASTDTNVGGGGIASEMGTMGNLTLDHVNFTGNTAAYAGGGVYGGNVKLTLTDCSFTNNAVNAASMTFDGFGGGVAVQDGFLIASDSTFDSNTVTNNNTMFANAYGGGIGIWGVDQGANVLTNCTITRNSVVAGNATDNDAAGGGVDVRASYGDFTMINCTVVGNGASDPSSPGAGGIDINLGYAAAIFRNNIIAANTNTSADKPDLYSYAEYGTTGSYNLIGDGTNSPFTDGTDNNQVGTTANPIDPKIGALADHGGTTTTISLLAASPAIDAGTDSGAPVTDQRGYTRSGVTDIGAFEFGGNVPGAAIITLAGGLLKVQGTAANDSIQVWVPKAAPTLMRVLLNGQTRNFARSSVTAVQVYGLAGDDRLTVNTRVADTYVFGADGNDTLVGGMERDILSGGDGNDVITGNEGDDRLNGNGGNDTLYGDAGADRLFGGAGRDLLDGGAGSDYFYGEAGSDVFHARDNTQDWLYGDNSDHGDSAQVDSLDDVNGIATLLA